MKEEEEEEKTRGRLDVLVGHAETVGMIKGSR